MVDRLPFDIRGALASRLPILILRLFFVTRRFVTFESGLDFCSMIKISGQLGGLSGEFGSKRGRHKQKPAYELARTSAR